MINFNKATIIGTLSERPVVKTTKNGKQFSTFKVAVMKKGYGDNGYKTIELEVSAFGKTSEALLNNPRAILGNLCLIECEVDAASYVDKTGNNRSLINLTANWINFDESPQVKPNPRHPAFEDDVPMF